MTMNGEKTAIVTGASTGIGYAVAETLARAGYRTFGTSRRVAGDGPKGAQMLVCDVTNQQSVNQMVAHVLAQTGRIDLVVNNAGLGLVGGAEESSLGQIQSLFDVNVYGVMRVTHAVLPIMKQQRAGRIINVSSVLGMLPAPYMAYYSATKHAVEGYSESLDHELRAFNIRVALVEPAYTRTAMESNALEPDAELPEYDQPRSQMFALNVQKIAEGDDPVIVAETVLRAATDQSRADAIPLEKPRKRSACCAGLCQLGCLTKACAKSWGCRPNWLIPATCWT